VLRDGEGQDLREYLIATAARLIGQRGRTGLAVRDIAREAGVADGVLYNYFEDKEDLLAHALLAHVGAVMHRVPRMPEAGSGTVAQNLELFIDRGFEVLTGVMPAFAGLLAQPKVLAKFHAMVGGDAAFAGPAGAGDDGPHAGRDGGQGDGPDNRTGKGAGENPGDGPGEVPGKGAGEAGGGAPGDGPGEGAGEVPGKGAGEVRGKGAGEVPGKGAGEVPGEGAGHGPGDPGQRGLPELLSAYLRAEQRLGRIRPAADIEAASTLVVGALHGQVLPRMLFIPPGTQLTMPPGLSRRLAQTVLTGLAPP